MEFSSNPPQLRRLQMTHPPSFAAGRLNEAQSVCIPPRETPAIPRSTFDQRPRAMVVRSRLDRLHLRSRSLYSTQKRGQAGCRRTPALERPQRPPKGWTLSSESYSLEDARTSSVLIPSPYGSTRNIGPVAAASMTQYSQRAQSPAIHDGMELNTYIRHPCMRASYAILRRVWVDHARGGRHLGVSFLCERGAPGLASRVGDGDT